MGLNDSGDDVYGLLAKDANGNHDSFSVLGEAYIQAEFSNTTLKLGRQELETPFVNTDDNRLAVFLGLFVKFRIYPYPNISHGVSVI